MRGLRAPRMTALIAAVVMVGSIASTAIASAQDGGGGGGESLEATDVGITADEIRIAVLADVENPLQPGLFQGAPDAITGFAKFVNKNGGLAGRKLVVDFIDSHLSADDTRNAIVEACENNFAMVGSASLFLNNIDDMVNCVNSEGTAIGLPDFPVLTTEPVHQCSPVSHPINPPTLDCATIDDHPQTYRSNIGADELLPEAERRRPGRRLPVPVRPQVGQGLPGPELQGQEEAGHQARRRVRRLGASAAERVHADRAADEDRRDDVRPQRPRVQLDHHVAQGGEAPGRRQRRGLGLLAPVLQHAAARAGWQPTSRTSTCT